MNQIEGRFGRASFLNMPAMAIFLFIALVIFFNLVDSGNVVSILITDPVPVADRVDRKMYTAYARMIGDPDTIEVTIEATPGQELQSLRVGDTLICRRNLYRCIAQSKVRCESFH